MKFPLCGACLLLAVFLFNNVPVNSQLRELDWWENTMFYQIYPRSFKDSDGDGIGDLQGVKNSLQHLKDAGIGATWLSPFYKSPQYDSGYDISDFFDIEPDFGTLADFDELLAEAKRLDIKIIMDLVPNHSSHECEWFQKSLNKSSEYADWYIWDDGKTDGDGKRIPPNNWVSVFRKSAWEYSEERDQFYLHQFAVQQPDFNFRNPAVVEKMKDVIRFWLNKGIAGFRIDAINHLFEVNKDDHGGVYPDEPLTGYDGQGPDDYGYVHHIYTKDIEDTYWMVYEFRKVFDEFKAKDNFTRVMLIEAYTSVQNTMKYFGNETSEGSHMPFNFGIIEDIHDWSSAKDLKFITDRWLTYMPLGKTANWVVGNHDKWRMGTRYGEGRIDGFNMMILLLPGAGITYNGEEIGMVNTFVSWNDTKDPQACNTDDPENYWKSSRDPSRTPYQWNGEKNAGFSTSDKTWLPVNENYQELNLELQKAAAKSHYKIYKECSSMRKLPTFSHGRYESVAFNDHVFAFERSLKGYDTYVIVINIGDKSHNVDLLYFPNVVEEITIKVSSVNSTKKPGDVIKANRVALEPYEALVLFAENSAANFSIKFWQTLLIAMLSIVFSVYKT